MLMKNKSVDVNIQDLDGHTALHWAADKGSSDIVKALLSSSNIRINTQNHEDGYCPLSIAVGGGFKDVVAILVEDERTDLNVSDKDGFTALHTAAKGISGNSGEDERKKKKDILEMLLKHPKVEKSKKDKQGKTAEQRVPKKAADVLKLFK